MYDAYYNRSVTKLVVGQAQEKKKKVGDLKVIMKNTEAKENNLSGNI